MDSRGDMGQQYWVGDFFVDASRNEITIGEDTQTLPPKALSVLTYLANNQGKVVSQDELLSEVWQQTIVSPNTLQRSIAQLRKVLGDDIKKQNVIKTHAKKGYSLECQVRWQDTPLQSSKNTPATEGKNLITHGSWTTRLMTKPFISLFFFVVLVSMSYQYWQATSAPQIAISQIRALTATDNKESAGIYSHDGKYIIFHRFSEQQCIK